MTLTLERRVARLAATFAPAPVRQSPVEIAAQLGITLDPWQRDVLLSDWDRALLVCSRQAGKSLTASILALTTAISLPGSLTLIVAPGERQAGLLFRTMAALYRSLGSAIETDVDNRLSMELSNGSAVFALPGKEATLRGFSAVDLIVADEAARIPDELHHAISPMLAVSGGRLVALSSPWGRRGWFYQAWAESADLWRRWRIPATEVPRISPAFLEAERKRLPAFVFEQEYMCAFLDDVDQFYASDIVDAAFSSAVRPLVL